MDLIRERDFIYVIDYLEKLIIPYHIYNVQNDVMDSNIINELLIIDKNGTVDKINTVLNAPGGKHDRKLNISTLVTILENYELISWKKNVTENNKCKVLCIWIKNNLFDYIIDDNQNITKLNKSLVYSIVATSLLLACVNNNNNDELYKITYKKKEIYIPCNMIYHINNYLYSLNVPTLFVSMEITNPSTLNNIRYVTNDIIANYPKTKNSFCDKIYLSFATLKCHNAYDLNIIINKLQNLQMYIKNYTNENGKYLSLKLNGLCIMKSTYFINVWNDHDKMILHDAFYYFIHDIYNTHKHLVTSKLKNTLIKCTIARHVNQYIHNIYDNLYFGEQEITELNLSLIGSCNSENNNEYEHIISIKI